MLVDEAVVPASAQVQRTRRLYRRFAPFYDAFRTIWSRWTRPVEEDLDRLFRQRIGPGARILELAPGTGINIERLLRCSPGFGSYLGIDSSEEMLARARTRSRGDERIDLRVGDATDLKDVANSFDFVASTWLLSHLDAPAATVRDALGKLAPGGTAVFVFFTAPRSRLLHAALRALHGPFSYQLVDAEPIRELPGLEQLSTCAGGIATLAVFRAPAEPASGH
ncbi:MAG: methyltransferase domain-containing protein [Myxococcota bacterium]